MLTSAFCRPSRHRAVVNPLIEHIEGDTGVSSRVLRDRSHSGGFFSQSQDDPHGELLEGPPVARYNSMTVGVDADGANVADLEGHSDDGALEPLLHGEECTAWVTPTIVPKQLLTTPMGRKSCAVRVKLDRARTRDLTNVQVPVVQFSCPIYYCCEDEGFLSVDIVRIGNLDCRSVVRYSTADRSAKAGERYEATKGEAVFEAGVREVAIKIPILYTESWGTTQEFVVELEAGGCESASIGRYLWQARVKVLDQNAFPNDNYIEDLGDGQFESIKSLALLSSYFKLNLEDPQIKSGTRKLVVVGQIHNLYFVLKLYLSVFLVDHVLKIGAGGDPATVEEAQLGICFVILATTLPYALLHFLDVRRFRWNVAGLCRCFLQSSLLRNFLNFTERSHAEVKVGDLMMAITRDAVQLVDIAYMSMLTLVQLSGRFLMVSVLRIVVPALSDTRHRINSWIIVSIMALPLFLSIFLRFRINVTMRALKNQDTLQNQLIHQVDQTVSNYRLIADYSRRPYFADRFEQCVVDYNAVNRQVAEVLENNRYIAEWLKILIVCCYTFVGGMEVLQGTTSLGIFLTDIKILDDLGELWLAFYNILVQLKAITPELRRIVTCMNLETDVPQRRVISRARVHHTKQLVKELANKGEDNGLAVDCLSIVLEGIQFTYSQALQNKPLAAIQKGGLRIHQGELVSLIGPRGQGKATLLKLLSEVHLPDWHEGADEGVDFLVNSKFFVPSHLRLLHVSLEPMFFHGTLLENLTFGCELDSYDMRESRIIAICRRMQVPEMVLEQMHAQRSWKEVLSASEAQLLNIARALVANPEIICIHKPVQYFDEQTGTRILQMLKEFIQQKGLEQDPDTWHLRRPRTVIMTNGTMMGVDAADRVFHISVKDGIREIDRHTVDCTMLD